MKIQLFAISLLSLCLASCATSRETRALPATDLAVTRLAVNGMTQPREPSADVKRVEDAADTGQLFALALSLEETLWLSNQDKVRIRTFVNDALDLIEKSRRPACSRWNLFCKD